MNLYRLHHLIVCVLCWAFISFYLRPHVEPLSGKWWQLWLLNVYVLWPVGWAIGDLIRYWWDRRKARAASDPYELVDNKPVLK